jgi:hypothetical protein
MSAARKASSVVPGTNNAHSCACTAPEGISPSGAHRRERCRGLPWLPRSDLTGRASTPTPKPTFTPPCRAMSRPFFVLVLPSSLPSSLTADTTARLRRAGFVYYGSQLHALRQPGAGPGEADKFHPPPSKYDPKSPQVDPRTISKVFRKAPCSHTAKRTHGADGCHSPTCCGQKQPSSSCIETASCELFVVGGLRASPPTRTRHAAQ